MFAIAAVLLPFRVQATTSTSPPPAPAEEVTLASLGLMAQSVHGESPSLDVRFPPPVASLAASGSYVRVFFGHSAQLNVRSTLQVSVNGQLLDTVPLTLSTSDGAVFVLQVPVMILHPDLPNLVEFAFSLAATAPAAGAELSARIDADTALHYQLGASAGTIEAYPYALLGGSLGGSLAEVPLGLVMPSSADDEELAAAFGLVADASRRLRGASLRIKVVAQGQYSWLHAGGSPALLVGRIADLPESASLLTAAGFTRSPGGWTAPGAGAPIKAGEGVVAAVVSPWDGHSPLLLATGDSDSGVALAAAAVLESRRLQGSGHAAVVPCCASAERTGAPDIPLRTLLTEALAIRGAGDHLVAFGVPVPAIAGSFAATMRLTLTFAGAAGAVSPDFSVTVAGRALQTPSFAAGPSRAESVTLNIDSELRPGMNGVTLNLRLPDGAGAARLETELSNFRQLPAPSGSSALDVLPGPFLGRPGETGATIALADMGPTTVAAAVTTMVALGSRAVLAPAPLSVIVLTRDHELPGRAVSVIVVGGPVGQALRLRAGSFRTEVISPPTAVPNPRSGWIAALDLPNGVSALWVGGDPQVLAATAMALQSADLRGHLAVVPADGVPRDLLGVSAGLTIEPVTIELARRLPLVVGALLLGLLAIELIRHRSRMQ
ncbi:MAG: cellulose biosynthesis cyclic di-GMP-binding regulatory protein BcsB [Candidatus Dormibacteraeota bacterium]|nr:cellulose biosynthesis cyclic di-GMP-binding regulatory protein BcsB [Candidatus Dormibacteraeota bacterium]